MTTQTGSLLQRYQLSEEIVLDWVPKSLKIQENVRYEVSIYALDFSIIHRIEYLINFVIDWYKGTDILNKPTTFRQLTPLHIAVISGHEEAAKKLIAAGANLNVKDKAHWTPLHHAALAQSPSLISILTNSGASQTIHSLTKGTFQDVINCLEPVDKDPSFSTGLFGEENDKPLTHSEFKRMTGAVYLHETHLTPELMLGEWNDTEEPHYKFSFEEKYAKQYSDFIKKPPMHQLKKVTLDSSGRKLSSSPGFGLYALRFFKTGEMIGEYKGLFRNDSSVVTAYSLRYSEGKGIDGLKFRNEIPQINDGFINVVLVPGRGIGGLTTRDLFIAADDIKEGEQFCWNYGFNPSLKLLSPYAELRPIEARAFIKLHQISDLAKCLEKVGRKTSTFEEFIKAEKFRYLLQTPAVVFLMILDGTITSNRGEQLLGFALSMQCIDPEEMLPELKNLPKLAQSCLTLKSQLSKQAPFLVQKYNEFSRSLPGKFGLLHSLVGLEKINSQLQILLSKPQSGFSAPVNENIILMVWDRLVAKNIKEIQALSDYYAKQIQLFMKP